MERKQRRGYFPRVLRAGALDVRRPADDVAVPLRDHVWGAGFYMGEGCHADSFRKIVCCGRGGALHALQVGWEYGTNVTGGSGALFDLYARARACNRCLSERNIRLDVLVTIQVGRISGYLRCMDGIPASTFISCLGCQYQSVACRRGDLFRHRASEHLPANWSVYGIS